MRVNIYAEEMTDRVEIIAKEIEGRVFTGLRFYLELPATVGGQQYQGPFMHRPSDDDSGAVTFWGKRDLRVLLRKALAALDKHYALHDEEREKWMTRATSTDDTESRIRAALRERDAAWRAAIVEADESCVHVTVAADAPCCSGCAPLRALLKEAGK